MKGIRRTNRAARILMAISKIGRGWYFQD